MLAASAPPLTKPARRLPELPGYAELHCRSNFSFLTGASHPAELIVRAQELRYAALALTDECSLAGVVRAHVAAQELPSPFHLIVGSEMRLSHGLSDAKHDHTKATHHADARLVLLAQTRRGYGNLSHWITLARRRAPKGHYLAYRGDLEGKAPTAPMLAGLPGCLGLLVPEASQTFDQVLEQALWLQQWFQERAAMAIERLNRRGDNPLRDTIRRVAAITGMKIVACGDVLMHVRSRKPLQDALTATRLNLPVAQCGVALEANAEAHLRPRSRLARLYAAEWMANSVALAKTCTFSLSELRYEYPEEIVPAGHTPTSWLRVLTHQGALRRYPPEHHPHGIPPAVQAAIEKELALIARLDYEPYFLTVADIVDWARSQNILCQGRGSAANSAVCFCLGVTEVNPATATLLFDRFISVERREPPDIDIDFEHQRREEVIQYIYSKYGRHRAALTGVVISYRPKSALRDVGRALGIDLQRVEAVSKSLHWWDGSRIDPDRLRENGIDPEAPVTQRWMALTRQIIGFPRHLSQHPGGFVIARHQIDQLVPVENATMAKRSVVQWDKDDLDALGLIKVDILALGMLSALRRTLDMVAQKTGRPFGMQDVPADDTPTYDMICRADTVGVFQIESRAQMSMLPRLKPRCLYDLVVEVAIVRPGPIQGGMVHPYLKNRTLPDDQIDCPDEILPALKRTKGVPIFQEQVMQIAMLAADFTGGEADQLRRAMAAWKRRGGLEPFEEKLVGRMVAKGYDPAYAQRIFEQIKGFGEYGFPESHAVGFALLAYASSWLKCHHPDAFLASLLNSQPMGFYAPAQLIRDAREHGVEVLPVDVTLSLCESTLVLSDETTEHTALPNTSPPQMPQMPPPMRPVRLGLDRVGGLPHSAAERIVAARAEAPFTSIEDLTRRAELDAHALQSLAQANALHALTGHRHQAAWAVAGIDTRPTPMLRETRIHEPPALLAAPSEAENTVADYGSVGFTLDRHPLALLREQLSAFKVQTAAVLRTYPSGRLARASGLVTHRQRPGTAKGTMFVTLEDETGAVNVIVWPKVVDAQRQPLLAARLLTVYGQWQREGDVMHLVASRMIDHTALMSGLVARSRDFR